MGFGFDLLANLTLVRSGRSGAKSLWFQNGCRAIAGFGFDLAKPVIMFLDVVWELHATRKLYQHMTTH